MNVTSSINNELPEVITAKELKIILHCGIHRAYSLMQSPAFPSIKIGGRYIVTKEALCEWLNLYKGQCFIID